MFLTIIETTAAAYEASTSAPAGNTSEGELYTTTEGTTTTTVLPTTAAVTGRFTGHSHLIISMDRGLTINLRDSRLNMLVRGL